MQELLNALANVGLRAEVENTGGGVLVAFVEANGKSIGIDSSSVCVYDSENEDGELVLTLEDISDKEWAVKRLALEARAQFNKYKSVMVFRTHAMFKYAGHTFAVNIIEQPNYYSGPDFVIETVSVQSAPFISQDGTDYGIYPRQFAEMEALDIIIDRITDKNAGSTFDPTESALSSAVRLAISEKIFEGVN
jgi:hypothetical protein